MCYNLRGGVSVKEDVDMNIIDTSFHDTLADNKRVAPHRDYHNLELAAFGDRVCSSPNQHKIFRIIHLLRAVCTSLRPDVQA